MSQCRLPTSVCSDMTTVPLKGVKSGHVQNILDLECVWMHMMYPIKLSNMDYVQHHILN